MGKIGTGVLKDFQDGTYIHDVDLDQTFEIIRVAINDTHDKLIKNLNIKASDGTIKAVQALASIMDILTFKEGAGITLTLETGNIVTIAVTDGSIVTAKIADLSITTQKIADLNVTTAKLADLSVTPAKLSAPVTYNTGDHSGTWFGLTPAQASEPINGGRLDILELLRSDNIKSMTAFPTFTTGKISKIEHKDAMNVIIRTDVFTFTPTLITEVRTLNTSQTITFKHYFDAIGVYLKTEVI